MTTLTTGRRTDPERFDTYTRWSIYTIYLLVPLLALAIVTPVRADAAPAAVFGLGSVVEAALALVVTAKAITEATGGRRMNRGWLVALLVLALALVVTALQLPVTDSLSGRIGAVALALALALVAVSAVLRPGVIAAGAVLVATVTAAVAAGEVPAVREPDEQYLHPVATFISVGAMSGGLVLSVRVSAWMLNVVWEQERTRAVHARLAVAEERLRFSRDLHDVVGRALSAIAVKSELGAELARRGQDGAADQMTEVRSLAQDTLKEVRGVVAGYRTADLAAELDGARSVLRSAGVSTRVTGDEAALPPLVQEALGWVVREAVTNVIRHARATSCTIDLEIDGDGRGRGTSTARLTIANDGVTADPRVRSGSGLVGLRERLAPLGGELTTVEGETFVLTAVVPLGARHSGDRPDRTTSGPPASDTMPG
ncbi:histidine kinase [Georgenia halophila]|uniref:Histidine kinase n=1 Tax=Georgenia halophila TaxID=620889 RepID=A0ABP8LKE5_9MICO